MQNRGAPRAFDFRPGRDEGRKCLYSQWNNSLWRGICSGISYLCIKEEEADRCRDDVAQDFILYYSSGRYGGVYIQSLK